MKGGKNIDYYEIGVRQHDQQVAASRLPTTTVWGYGPPSRRAVARRVQRAVADDRGKWNARCGSSGSTSCGCRWEVPTPSAPRRPDAALGQPAGRHTIETCGDFRDARPLLGPVPIVTHVHGAVGRPTRATATPRRGTCPMPRTSDGYARSVLLRLRSRRRRPPARSGQRVGTRAPRCSSIPTNKRPPPSGTTTTRWDDPAQRLRGAGRVLHPPWRSGDDVAMPLASPPSFPGPPRARRRPGTTYYEIPIAIQDRSFNDDGSLFFPDTRAFFDEFLGPYIGDDATSHRSGTPSSSATHHRQRQHLADPGRAAAPLPVPLPQRLQHRS